MNLRLVVSGAGMLVVAGAVVGSVALASSPAQHHAPAAPPAAPVTTSAPNSASATVAMTTSAAPKERPTRVARSTHHAVAPKKETTVANEPADQQPADAGATPAPTEQHQGAPTSSEPPHPHMSRMMHPEEPSPTD